MSTPLAERSALIIGAGGLGAPALLVLAGAGVGRIVLVDGARVGAADLSRQPLLLEADLGEPRGAAAARRAAGLFPRAQIEVQGGPLAGEATAELVRGADVVVEAAEDLASKFQAGDAAVRAGRPIVHGGALRAAACALTVLPGRTGCLRCLFEEPPGAGIPGWEEAGVLGAVAGVAGALLGAEAARLLAGERGSYAGRMVVFDGRSAKSRIVKFARRADCPVCGALGRSGEGAPPAPEARS